MALPELGQRPVHTLEGLRLHPWTALDGRETSVLSVVTSGSLPLHRETTMNMKKIDLKDAPDEQLLALFGAGEPLAGDVLLTRYRPGIYSFFARKVPAADADELTQQVLAVLMRVPTRSEPIHNTFRGFTFGVARMTLRNYCGKKAEGRKFDPDLQSLTDLDPSLSKQLSERNRMSWLNSAIENLPVETQVLLDLRYGQGLGYREIAAIYDEPEPTLRRRVQAIKAKLQAMRQRFEDRPGRSPV